jgi:hypothetical protein
MMILVHHNHNKNKSVYQTHLPHAKGKLVIGKLGMLVLVILMI